jgi:hypothetical protein
VHLRVASVALQKYARIQNSNRTYFYGKRTTAHVNAEAAKEGTRKLRREVPDEIDDIKIACARIDHISLETSDGGPITVNGRPWRKMNTIRVTIRGCDRGSHGFSDRNSIVAALRLAPGAFFFQSSHNVFLTCSQITRSSNTPKDFL